MRHVVLIVGATGVFGRRLAQHLAPHPRLSLLVASRSAAKAQRLAARLDCGARGIAFDTGADIPAQLADLRPWAVVDCSGPFQGAAYALPRAALEAGAHFVDLADARDYIAGFSGALDQLAGDRRRVALTGASSSPALSRAVVEDVTRAWRRIDSAEIAITPGGRAQIGASVIAAALSYAGKPIRGFDHGAPGTRTGWMPSHVIEVPRLGRRRVGPVETYDTEYLPQAFGITNKVVFDFGLESRAEQWGLELIARLRKAGLMGDPLPLLPAMRVARRLMQRFAGARGGMVVSLRGLGPDGRFAHARWSLLAPSGHGPSVPILPIAASIERLLKGAEVPGARIANLPLAAIGAEMARYEISTQVEQLGKQRPVFGAALGAAFGDLAPALQAFHAAHGPALVRGEALVERGGSLLARIACWIGGLPRSAASVPVSVSVTRSGGSAPHEIWERRFGASTFHSRLSLRGPRRVTEAFGPLAVDLATNLQAGGLALPIAGWRLFGVPLPRWLGLRSRTREYQDDKGRFRFDVDVRFPWGGRLIRYAGWLVPAAAASGPTESAAEPRLSA
ncbi:MAG: DUF4166 domain-containing protein [Rhodobacteraceae bacterium]|nr:DUF4166 domain-containing protein [Paracoccaceae bacterium]